MTLPGLDSMYWVAYASSRGEGEFVARCYAIGFTGVIVTFPIIALIELSSFHVDGEWMLPLAYAIGAGATWIFVDRRRNEIVTHFARCGLRFNDRLLWTIYTICFVVSVIGLSSISPLLCLVLFVMFVFLPVRWTFRPTSRE